MGLKAACFAAKRWLDCMMAHAGVGFGGPSGQEVESAEDKYLKLV
jgi:hypothetical protein